MAKNSSHFGKTENLYLAIDQGGHASRAIVFDANGNIAAEAFTEIATQHPAPDRVEHGPEEMLQSINQALAEIAGQLGPHCSRVCTAGLATQRSSIVCWDRMSGEALSPVISWQDRRGTAWLEQFRTHTEQIHACTGLRLSPHYGASKLRWCLDHLSTVEKALGNGHLAWGPLASFLLFRLLKERPLVADPANASRTLLWDFQTLDWSQKLLELFGLPREPLPQCVPSRHPYGQLLLGKYWVPLGVATGDQSAALFAYGPPQSSTIYINIGTGAFVQRPENAGIPDPGQLLASVVFQDSHKAQYVLEGTVNGAGSALDWAQRQLHLAPKDMPDQLANALRQNANPVLFLNGVSGLGSPYWIADFPSRFIGDGTTLDKISAVAESILFLLQLNIESLKEHPPALQHILISGGMAAQKDLCQRLADLTGLPVRRPSVREATARGLAFLMTGHAKSWPASQTSDCFQPNNNPPLQQRYQRWCSIMVAALEKNPE